MRRLPPLSSLRAFEAAARLGSVTKAAAEIGRTHGAVSRQIRSLQEAVGVPLFDKAGTGLRLNGTGQGLLDIVGEAFDGLEEGWARLLADLSGPSLHVACSATFAMRWLVPRLPDFYRREPAIRLRLSMTTAAGLRHEGADLVIAWDRSQFPEAERARAIRLAEVAFGPVAAPDYPVTRKPGSLRFAVRIGYDVTSRAWDTWQERAAQRTESDREISFPHTHLCIEAAIGGLGVALVEERLVATEIASGRLVAPLGFAAFGDGLAAVPTSERMGSAAARAFIDWMTQQLRPDAT